MSVQHDPQNWVEVGCVTRAHGIRGEVRVKLHNEDSEVLFEQEEVLLRQDGAPDRTVRIAAKRAATPGIVLLAFDGVTARPASEALRGATLHVPRSALPEPNDDEFYVHDILGADVVTVDGDEVGKVIDYLDFPSADVIVVKGNKRFEIPMVEDFVRDVDVDNKRIVVDDIDGFETS